MKASALIIILQVLVLRANPITKNITQFNDADDVDLNWRLPKAIHPMSYQIELSTRVDDNGNRDYSGTVIILLDVREATDKIILHVKELMLDELLLFDGVTNVDDIIYGEDETRDFLIIETQHLLRPGSDLMLYIQFRGQLQLSGVGFYRSEYKVDGETRYLATTQFEASYARYAFPLFDGEYIYDDSMRKKCLKLTICRARI